MNNKPSAHALLSEALEALIGEAQAARKRLFTRDADTPKDEEALHDFRVALRRLRTLLRVGRKLWGKQRLARIEGELRHYAHATGALRDEEVLRETLASLELPDAARAELGGWLVRRGRRVRAKHVAVEKLILSGPKERVEAFPGGKRVRPLDRSFEKLLELLKSHDTVPWSTKDLGKVALESATAEVKTRAAADVSDVEAMHALRIGEKRLRYAAELFVSSHGSHAAQLAKRAMRMQKRLGELHDIDEARIQLGRARGLSKATRDAVAAALRVLRVACAEKLEPHLAKTRQLPEHKDAEIDALETSPATSSA